MLPAAFPREARKTVTALFAGVRIFSAQGRTVDPEALRHVTSRMFAEVKTAVDRHGGTIETVAGDAVTAVFGLPIVHEDDALRGVRAAVEIRDRLADLKKQLESERPVTARDADWGQHRRGRHRGRTGNAAACHRRAIDHVLAARTSVRAWRDPC